MCVLIRNARKKLCTLNFITSLLHLFLLKIVRMFFFILHSKITRRIGYPMEIFGILRF